MISESASAVPMTARPGETLVCVLDAVGSEAEAAVPVPTFHRPDLAEPVVTPSRNEVE